VQQTRPPMRMTQGFAAGVREVKEPLSSSERMSATSAPSAARCVARAQPRLVGPAAASI